METALSSLLSMVEDLPKVEREWTASRSAEEYLSFAVNWNILVAQRLPELHYRYLSKGMRVDQYDRYGRLLQKLDKSRARIERLGLNSPNRVFEDAGSVSETLPRREELPRMLKAKQGSRLFKRLFRE